MFCFAAVRTVADWHRYLSQASDVLGVFDAGALGTHMSDHKLILDRALYNVSEWNEDISVDLAPVALEDLDDDGRVVDDAAWYDGVTTCLEDRECGSILTGVLHGHFDALVHAASPGDYFEAFLDCLEVEECDRSLAAAGFIEDEDGGWGSFDERLVGSG